MKKSLLILGLVIAGCTKNRAATNDSITNTNQTETALSVSQPVVIKEPDYIISNDTGIITFAEYTKDSEKYDYSTNEYFILYEELYGKYFSKENLFPHIRVRNGNIKQLSPTSHETNFSWFKFPQAGTVITYTNEYGIPFFNEELVFDPEFVLTIPESQYGLSALYSKILFPYFCEAYKNEGYFRKNLMLYWLDRGIEPSITGIYPWFREKNSLMGMISGITLISLESTDLYFRSIAGHLPESARETLSVSRRWGWDDDSFLELQYYIFSKIFSTNDKKKLKISLLNFLIYQMFSSTNSNVIYIPGFQAHDGYYYYDPNSKDLFESEEILSDWIE